jgi:hypothetical protein
LSTSGSGRSDAGLSRQSTARLEDVGSPRTRTADGRSSEERVSEEQAFERAAAQLRPAWATGQARQYLVAPSAGTPISSSLAHGGTPRVDGTTPLPDGSTVGASSSALPAVRTVGPTVQSATPNAAHAAEGAVRHDGELPAEIELSDAIYEGEPLLDPQPVYAASHSNFPAQPFDVGVTPSTQFRSRHITGDTGDFSRVPGKPPRNVRLLAIGAAACLVVGSVWALASGDSPSSNDAGRAAVTPAPAKPPAAPAALAPAAAVSGAASGVPAELPSGRELPASLLPSRSTRETGSAPSSAVAKPNKVDSKASTKARKGAARTTAVSAKAPLKATAKVTTKGAPTKLGTAPAAPKSKALPAAKQKPQAKPAAKSRVRTNGVVDPWGR